MAQLRFSVLFQFIWITVESQVVNWVYIKTYNSSVKLHRVQKMSTFYLFFNNSVDNQQILMILAR